MWLNDFGRCSVCLDVTCLDRSFVLCFSAALRVTCCGRWLVPVSTLLILRALYLLYTAALRNLTGFLRAKIRLWITSIYGQN